MKKKKIVVILVVILVLLLGVSVLRINPRTPVGAIRYECLQQGHILSALFLHAEKTDIDIGNVITVYKVTFAAPYEKDTATYLDQWNVTKQEDGTYLAAYGVG